MDTWNFLGGGGAALLPPPPPTGENAPILHSRKEREAFYSLVCSMLKEKTDTSCTNKLNIKRTAWNKCTILHDIDKELINLDYKA